MKYIIIILLLSGCATRYERALNKLDKQCTNAQFWIMQHPEKKGSKQALKKAKKIQLQLLKVHRLSPEPSQPLINQ